MGTSLDFMACSKLTHSLHSSADYLNELSSSDTQIWIGICGIPGSGKSHISDILLTLLTDLGVSAVVVPLDGYHYSRATLDTFPNPSLAHYRRGEPSSFDVEKMVHDLSHAKTVLKSDESSDDFICEFPLFDHAYGDPSMKL
jgi:pantothenate kinase